MSKVAQVFRLLASGDTSRIVGGVQRRIHEVQRRRYSAECTRKDVDLGFVPCKDLGLSADRAGNCADSGGPDMVRMLKKLAIPQGSKVIDFGSGKGGAAFTLGSVFDEVLGLEISGEMVRIAETNRAKLQVNNVRFVEGDACTFTDLDRFTHIYMYSPFYAEVMGQVLANLAESLKRAPRRVTLIYTNPVCHDTTLQSGLFTHSRDIQMGTHAVWGLVRIYEHKPAH